jgi:aspartyl-tRNA(Asn)/glutamyl-tRNA(Gln) amidotransferase subunit C
LSDGEQLRMSEELSKVLDHIEKIAELGDLEDVEPTSHVTAVENVLRADEPRPSLPAEIALQSAPEPDMGGFRVPSPGPAPA